MADIDSLTATIRRLEHERCNAMIQKDIPALERLLDDELIYTHSSGVVDTKRSYIDGVRKLLALQDDRADRREDHRPWFNSSRLQQDEDDARQRWRD